MIGAVLLGCSACGGARSVAALSDAPTQGPLAVATAWEEAMKPVDAKAWADVEPAMRKFIAEQGDAAVAGGFVVEAMFHIAIS